MTTQRDPLDPSLANGDTLDAGPLPGDTDLSNDQRDELNQAGNRGDYGETTQGDQDGESRYGIDTGSQNGDEYGGQSQYPNEADPSTLGQGATQDAGLNTDTQGGGI